MSHQKLHPKLTRLRIEAQEQAAENGHLLGDFLTTRTPHSYAADCVYCGMQATISLNPLRVGGETQVKSCHRG
jgi:hypothetical protein